ncbi:MAG: aminodeoxychorismate lyase [Woeseiaceae bacterium]
MTKSMTSDIDRAAAYGDGVFETIAIRGGQARYWNAHLERLQTACLRLGLQCPSPDKLAALLTSELNGNSGVTEFATARLVVSAAPGPRGYRRKANAGTAASCHIYASQPVDQRLVRDGVEVRMCTLRLAIQPALAGMKTLNRLEQILARAEWDEADVFEGLTLDTDGRLICGTMSNVFIVSESRLCTPGITRCGVAGIMRARVMQRLRDAGVTCNVRDIAVDELRAASEIFLTNSQFGVLPVRRIDELEFEVGAITRQVQTLMAADGVPESMA